MQDRPTCRVCAPPLLQLVQRCGTHPRHLMQLSHARPVLTMHGNSSAVRCTLTRAYRCHPVICMPESGVGVELRCGHDGICQSTGRQQILLALHTGRPERHKRAGMQTAGTVPGGSIVKWTVTLKSDVNMQHVAGQSAWASLTSGSKRSMGLENKQALTVEVCWWWQEGRQGI